MSETSTEIFELFERNPLEMSEEDFKKVIVRMREQRKNFDLTGAKATAKKPATKKRASVNLDLGELKL